MEKFMKNDKGITLMTLMIYIISLIIAIAILTIVTTYFRSNLDKMRDNSLDIAEHDKFKVYFLEETKRKDNEVSKDPEGGTEIKFTSGNKYKYIKSDSAVYLINTTENIKVAERVKYCRFYMEKEGDKTILTVVLEVGNERREVQYVMEKGNAFGNYDSEGNYISTGKIDVISVPDIPEIKEEEVVVRRKFYTISRSN